MTLIAAAWPISTSKTMTGPLEERVILITGSTGIAAATARLAGAQGARLFIAALDAAATTALVEDLQRQWITVEAQAGDLSNETVVERVVAACVARYGRIDGLFNVAGISGRRYGDGPVHASTREGWRMTFQHNLDPTWLMCREVVRVMMEQAPGADGQRGSILNMTSVLAAAPEPDHFATHAYAAAKGAITSLTLAMASCYARDRIRVNALAPGLVRTPMSARAQSNPEILDLMKRKQPLQGDLIEADQVARAALFLLGSDSSSITGEIMTIDAGWKVS